ncbi:uncharacterized protein LOC134853829 [Symsagittifera roscoffensis]|uniref:uncharacterized protein LOC134853829 n=1 Tax=Symsagittifera roscoffensis TaxID=84072 RepID=UPI00307BC5AA
MEKYLFHDRPQNQGNSSGKFVGAKYTVRSSDDSLDQSASTVLTRVSGFPSRSENAQTSVPRMQLVGMGGTTKQDNGNSFQIQRLRKFKQMVNLFVILLVSFFVLMSPFRLLTLFRSITECSLGQRVEGWERLILDISLPLSSVVFAANSIVNPILFNILSSRFRQKSARKIAKVSRLFRICIDEGVLRRHNSCEI